MSSSTTLTFQSCPQNVLELTLGDKDILNSDQLSILRFDLSSLQPGKPHTKNFPLKQEVRSTWVSSK